MVFPELERIFLFLDKMQKARIIKEKSDKLKYNKLKFKTYLKTYVRKKVKNQVTDWDKISASQIKNRELVPRRVLKFLDISKKKTNSY